MLGRIAVRNFQSLREIDLELGKLTVIVGESSAGKSALMRAIRVLVSNSRGAPYVSYGAQVAVIQASAATGDNDGQGWVVTLERGEGVGRYRVWSGSGEATFTKLGGTVPPEVTAVVGIDPIGSDGSSVVFASQFDRPYLLDDSGAAVARTLGELTNVNVIFEAAREANRRRLVAASTVKTRTSDLGLVMVQAGAYAGLGVRLAALAGVEETLALATVTVAALDRLRSLVADVEVMGAGLVRLSAAAEVVVPDYGPVVAAQEALGVFRGLLGVISTASREVATSTAAVDLASATEATAHAELHQLLVDVGQCPTCGADTSALLVGVSGE